MCFCFGILMGGVMAIVFILLRDCKAERSSDPINCYDGAAEIDLREYLKILCKHQRIFFIVFCLIFILGLVRIPFLPKIYRVSMLVQPPNLGKILSPGGNLEFAENLKSSVLSGVFNDELNQRIGLDLSADRLKFITEIPYKTDSLKISIDLDDRKKDLGVVILRDLADVIASRYARQIELKSLEIEDELFEKTSALESLRNQTEQANSLKDISKLQKAIDKLNTKKSFVSNVKLLSSPNISPNPVSPNKRKILAHSLLMGLFFGVLAALLKELWIVRFPKSSQYPLWQVRRWLSHFNKQGS